MCNICAVGQREKFILEFGLNLDWYRWQFPWASRVPDKQTRRFAGAINLKHFGWSRQLISARLNVCSHDPDFSFSVFSSADEIFTRSFSSDFPHSLILIDFSRFSSDASKFVVLHRQIYIFSPQREVCTQDFLALIQIFSFSKRAAFPLEISPNFHSTNSANGLHCFQPFLLILQLLCFLFSLRPFFLRTRKNRSWKKVVPRENFHRGFTHFATRLFIQLKAYRSLRIPSIFIPSNLPFDNKIFIGK